MAIKVKKEFQDLIALISNIFETYTTALFIYNEADNSLKLKHFYSLTNNIKENFSFKINKKLKFWLNDLKKPVSCKSNEKTPYHEFLNLYKKKENIKLLYAIPIEDYQGVLYIDTKKVYALPEKHQKLLFHCGKIISHMLNIENAAKEIKSTLNYFDFAKKLKFEIDKLVSENTDINNFIHYLSEILNFEFGCIVKNNFDGTFRIIGTNNKNLKNITGKNLNFNDNVIGSLLKKNIRHFNYIEEIPNNIIFFNKNENIRKNKIKNYLYFPFLSGRNVFASLIFFNFNKEIDFAKFYSFCYDIFHSIIYEQIAKEHLDFIIKMEPISGFIRDYYFYEMIKNNFFQNKGLIFIKNQKFTQILNRYHIDYVLKSYKFLKKSIDKILDENCLAGFFSLNSVGIIFSNNNYNIDKKLLLVEKSFKNRFIKIDNLEINLDFYIKVYKNLEQSKIKILTKSYGV